LENREPSARILIDSCDAIVVDEAHRNLDWIESIGEDIARKKRKTRLIGITATPSRAMISETGRLASLFGNRVFVPIEGGERNPEGMADKLTNIGILSERIEIEPENLFGNAPEGKREFAIIEALLDSGSDSIIVFTNTVEEARNLASISRLSEKIGVNAEHIDAGTPLSSRRSTIEAFRNGEVQVLFNYGILTTGFDAPNIDAVVILRRSIDRSSSLFSQMVGRGLRGPKFGGTEQCRIVHYRGD
jgi:superfamily II DNA or RNA helicase